MFLFLIAVNVAFVPLAHWWQTFIGFFSFSGLPQPIDWGLIGALAATAGSGGIGNLTVTNWVRDKGFGMGAKVGAIPSAVGGARDPAVARRHGVPGDARRTWRAGASGCATSTPIRSGCGACSASSGCS